MRKAGCKKLPANYVGVRGRWSNGACKHCFYTCIRSSEVPVGSHSIVGRRAQKSGHRLEASPYWITSCGLASVTFHKKKPSFKPNYTRRNIENTVGLRQVGIKSLSGCHLCLFEVVSLDLLPLHSQSNRNETHLQKLQ